MSSGGQRGDVARAQDERHAGALRAAAVPSGRLVPYLLGAGAGQHPDLGREAVQQEAVPAGGGEDVDPGAAVLLVHRAHGQRIPAGGDPAQYVQAGSDVLGQRPGAAGPVLRGPGGVRGVPLGASAGRGQFGRAVADPRHEPLQQADPLGERCPGPGRGVLAQFAQGAVERTGVEGAAVHITPLWCRAGGVGAGRQESRRRASRAGSMSVNAAVPPIRSSTPVSSTACW